MHIRSTERRLCVRLQGSCQKHENIAALFSRFWPPMLVGCQPPFIDFLPSSGLRLPHQPPLSLSLSSLFPRSQLLCSFPVTCSVIGTFPTTQFSPIIGVRAMAWPGRSYPHATLTRPRQDWQQRLLGGMSTKRESRPFGSVSSRLFSFLSPQHSYFPTLPARLFLFYLVLYFLYLFFSHLPFS